MLNCMIGIGEKQGKSAKINEREVSNGIEDSVAPTILVTTANEGVTAAKIDEITPTSAPTIYLCKRKDQVALDEEMARNLEAQLQAELIKEEKMARKKEEEANIALIESWENTQAMMKANKLLARDLQNKQQEELTDEENAKLFMEFMERRRKHFNEEVEEDNEVELKMHMVIVKDDDIVVDAIPLASKPLGIDRKDLETLYKLVQTQSHGDTRPEDNVKRVVGCFKVMLKPGIKSDVWRNLPGYKVTIWKLYDSCGVHFVRLSHLNFDYINEHAKQGLVRGLPKLKSDDSIQEKLYLLHMDLCGPMRIESINGKKYILVIVDDYAQFTWVKFLRSKGETPEIVIKLLKKIQVRLNATVCRGSHDSFALCYPTNDGEDPGKLKPKADIGIFLGYAPAKKAYRIYNRRTCLIMETIHVEFDELTTMASEQFGSGFLAGGPLN
ncbi:retrovirus-related pol polyprotein from transposon TNT 1-94 [Tanacetum coccineum]